MAEPSHPARGRYLIADVHFVAGTYHGKSDRDSALRDTRGRKGGVPFAIDWPPSPGRLLGAAVAGVGMHKGASYPVAEHPGLKSIATLPPPIILARERRDIPTSFVQTAGPDNTSHREKRTLVLKGTTRALLGENETVSYAFPLVPGHDDMDDAIQALMGIVALGRPMDDVVVHAYPSDRLPDAAGRKVYVPQRDGRVVMQVGTATTLADMQARQKAELGKIGADGRTIFRDMPPRISEVRYAVEGAARPRGSVFVLRGTDGRMATIPAARTAAIAIAIRDKLLAGVEARPGSRQGIEIKGVGAGPDDIPARIRIVPMPSVGNEHADGLVRRVAVLFGPETTLPGHAVEDVLDGADIVVGNDAVLLEKAFRIDSGANSMDGVSRTMLGESRVWRSVTPMLLPGSLPRNGRGGESEARWRAQATSLVMKAIEQAGMDGSLVEHVSVHGYSESIDVPAHLRRFEKVETTIGFRRPVRGPLVLGPGRFLGLGAMAPSGRRDPTRSFVVAVDPTVQFGQCIPFAETLRRGVIGIAGSLFGKDRVPPSISGHDGRRAYRDGGRHDSLHVFPDPTHAGTDGRVTRFVLGLPESLRHEDARTLGDAMRDWTFLRGFGPEGTRILVSDLDEDTAESMRKRSTVFRTLTPFRAPSLAVGETVESAVENRLLERKMPRPSSIRVLGEVGQDLFETRSKYSFRQRSAYHVEVEFDVAVPGPIRLGSDAHFGGGLFVPVTP